MKNFTIGFTRKSAAIFFDLLRQPGLVRVLDIRLNNTSQLAGFTKKEDLSFFAEELNGISYVHEPMLAPNAEFLAHFKKNGGNWASYEEQFLALLTNRQVESHLSPKLLDGACLLCSEPSSALCHRRLVAEYFQAHWQAVEIEHLV